MTQKKEQVDQYIGEREPFTRIRHGKGEYIYDNNFFSYKGEWKHGKKHGKGVFTMKNGTIYTGDFDEGEMTGKGKMVWGNQDYYIGQFVMGEKQGKGCYKSTKYSFVGEWLQNCMHGKGLLKYENNDTVDGEFKNNKPDGFCTITRINGSSYVGEMQRGLMHGKGKLVNKEKKYVYDGEFKEDKMCGTGLFEFDSGFQIKTQWVDDKPIKLANRFFVEQYIEPEKVDQLPNQPQNKENQSVSNPEEEQKQKQVETQKQEQKVTFIQKDVIIEYELMSKPFSITIKTCYQGPDQLDPVQPTQEEIDGMIKEWEKANKKQKNPPPMPDFKAPRMCKPPLEFIDFESGRSIKVTMRQEIPPEKGKENEPIQYKFFRFDYREDIQKRKKQIQQIQEQQQLLLQQQKEADQRTAENQEKGKKELKKKDNKKQSKQQQEPGQEDDLKINLYKEDENENSKPLVIINEKGTVLLKDLEYPENFPSGQYQILVTEGNSQEKFGDISEQKIILNINPIGGQDPKKKKK